MGFDELEAAAALTALSCVPSVAWPDDVATKVALVAMLSTCSRSGTTSHTTTSTSRQDRSRWDRALIAEGHALVRACLRRDQPGPFQIQAAITAVHADAATAEDTDWSQVVALYDQLYALRPNAVVALNRTIAISQLYGPAAGLAALESLETSQLEHYQPYHAARADLFARAGQRDAARTAYDRAIELSANPTERRFLGQQRGALADDAQ